MHATKPYCFSPTYPKMWLNSSFDILKSGHESAFTSFRIEAETSGSSNILLGGTLEAFGAAEL